MDNSTRWLMAEARCASFWGQSLLFDICSLLMCDFTSARASAWIQCLLTRLGEPIINCPEIHPFVITVRFLTINAMAIFLESPFGKVANCCLVRFNPFNPLSINLTASFSSCECCICPPACFGFPRTTGNSRSRWRNSSDPKHQPLLSAFNMPSSMAPPLRSSRTRCSNASRYPRRPEQESDSPNPPSTHSPVSHAGRFRGKPASAGKLLHRDVASVALSASRPARTGFR